MGLIKVYEKCLERIHQDYLLGKRVSNVAEKALSSRGCGKSWRKTHHGRIYWIRNDDGYHAWWFLLLNRHAISASKCPFVWTRSVWKYQITSLDNIESDKYSQLDIPPHINFSCWFNVSKVPKTDVRMQVN